MTWVLILTLLSPGGDIIEQQYYPVKDRQACVKTSREIKSQPNPMQVKYQTRCLPASKD